jgi:hypothetical protein
MTVARRECKPETDHGTSPLNRFTEPPSRGAAENPMVQTRHDVTLAQTLNVSVRFWRQCKVVFLRTLFCEFPVSYRLFF